MIYRILSVPVWSYRISVGSEIRAAVDETGVLRFQELARPSPGATVRLIVPAGAVASQVYLQHVIPQARKEGMAIGPATFFNPRLVAIHVHARSEWWPKMGEFLNRLIADGIGEQWEVADPDEYGVASGLPPQSEGPVLMHPLPADDTEASYLN